MHPDKQFGETVTPGKLPTASPDTSSTQTGPSAKGNGTSSHRQLRGFVARILQGVLIQGVLRFIQWTVDSGYMKAAFEVIRDIFNRCTDG